MAWLAPFEELPGEEVIEEGLARLCTKALRTYWILEPDGQSLLRLVCVQAYLKADVAEPVERDYAKALRAYLEDAVQRVASLPYRKILEVVLGLGDPTWKAKSWRHQTAKVRRAEAGRLFREPEEDDDDDEVSADALAGESAGDGVAGDTIRQHHERRAIKVLAEVVFLDEQQAQLAAANGTKTR